MSRKKRLATLKKHLVNEAQGIQMYELLKAAAWVIVNSPSECILYYMQIQYVHSHAG